jgi:NADPH-dependent 2,4-dienoyl-CoA reductase/sulfur reductase-like enzyme/rhodanese-related sulfurtransferase
MAVQTPQSLHAKLNIDVRVNTRVELIDTEKKFVTARNERTSGETMTVHYDELILAVGAEPLKPPIPGINREGLFALRNLEDMDKIDSFIRSKHTCCPTEPAADHLHCVVAGAGFVGLEMVEQLMRRHIEVTVVEMMPQILGPIDVEMANILQQDLEKRGVHVVTGDGIKEFLPSEEDPVDTVVMLQSGKKLPAAQFVVLGLGVRPDTAIVTKAGIETTRRGHIVVDEHLKTSVPHVWAVGDAIEVKNPIIGGMWAVPLAGPANRQGRMVADNIYGKNRSFKGTYGASVVRIFDNIAASVGMNEKMLKANNIEYAVVNVHPGSHAGYYPGAKPIYFKLIFDPKDGKIFGAQAVGEDGVEKRIDVISTAMQGGMTVEDLAEIELCYAPPVGSAKDPVNIAGMAAQNVMEGMVQQVQWADLAGAIKEGATVLDVRNASEIKIFGKLVQESVDIPLPELRSRLNELPIDKDYVVSCMSGQRSYYASRILMQNGYNVRNLSGAFKTYSMAPAAAK